MTPTTTAPTGAAARPVDPRSIITEDAFRLAPELLGTPLARPWRRGAAMAIDGVLIGLLSNAPSVLLAFAGALLLFRISGSQVEGSYLRKSARLMLRFWGAVILFVGVLAVWDNVADRIDDDAAPAAPGLVRIGAGADGEGVPGLSGIQGLQTAADIARLTQASTEEEARALTATLVPALRRAGMDDEEIREVLVEVAASPDKPWLAAAADSAIAGLAPPESAGALPATAVDSLLAAYAAAVEAQDSALAAEIRPRVALALAADTLSALRRELDDERSARARVARELDAAEERLEEGPGIVGTISRVADELGIGLGWAGLYFTAFLTLWRGRTPGKRAMRIRVIRLDGKPLGWWASFERFGGYAAGVVTGLLGFAQVYWDRNRQMVHDKISETVVIDA